MHAVGLLQGPGAPVVTVAAQEAHNSHPPEKSLSRLPRRKAPGSGIALPANARSARREPDNNQCDEPACNLPFP
jgi:hypothetical protein